MRARLITHDQAVAVLQILRDACGYCADPYNGKGFVRAITDKDRPCEEWRFIGALGFGGKFRNNGNNDGIPYVDCNPEDETPERRAMVDAANTRLRLLFDATLSDADQKILAALDERGGTLTGDVARQASPWGHPQRIESAWVRNHLLALQARGLVTQLDGQKPACWLRTPAGTAALTASAL